MECLNHVFSTSVLRLASGRRCWKPNLFVSIIRALLVKTKKRPTEIHFNLNVVGINRIHVMATSLPIPIAERFRGRVTFVVSTGRNCVEYYTRFHLKSLRYAAIWRSNHLTCIQRLYHHTCGVKQRNLESDKSHNNCFSAKTKRFRSTLKSELRQNFAKRYLCSDNNIPSLFPEYYNE